MFAFLQGNKFRPSALSIKILICLGLTIFALAYLTSINVAPNLLSSLNSIVKAVTILLLFILPLDILVSARQEKVRVERRLTGNMSVNRWHNITLIFHHPFKREREIEIFDGVPDDTEFENAALSLTLRPNRTTIHTYRLRPFVRGPVELNECHVISPSVFRLWDIAYKAPCVSEIKVYPDFNALSAYTILATDNHVSQIGIKRKPRRGEGLDFHQLRDYRKGDSLRQIDWKATSRRQNLISKEYQDERDQHIVLLIDSGRRMRTKDDQLSHFDHSLNAMLLLGYIALRQGDNVSVMSFGNQSRWVPPQKGATSMNLILNEMYDLQAGNVASDYIGAAQQLASLQTKRSLVILVSNPRDEDSNELMIAVNLLRQRHLVLLANIREKVIEDLQKKDVNNLDDAFDYAGSHSYLSSRKEAHQKLTRNGTYAIDCLPSELAVYVANSYLEIKRAGVL